jgi:hypothetical protein
MIYKRTFEALKHPKGSAKRIELNKDAITSEYMLSYKYQAKGENYSFSYRTKADAELVEELRAHKRLEKLRKAIKAENISYGEIAELQGLVKYIDAGDVELLEWAGVPEQVTATDLINIKLGLMPDKLLE